MNHSLCLFYLSQERLAAVCNLNGLVKKDEICEHPQQRSHPKHDDRCEMFPGRLVRDRRPGVPAMATAMICDGKGVAADRAGFQRQPSPPQIQVNVERDHDSKVWTAEA